MTDTPQTHDQILASLNELLDRERSALLDGDLQAIGPLLEEKTALISGLEDATPAEADSIRPVQMKLRRNQELFDQALAGIRNVASRLGDMRQVRKSMEIYDSNGNRASIGGEGAGSFERRA